MRSLFALSIAATTATLVTSTASAHIRLMSPAPRYLDQKSGPCGRALNDVRGGTVTTFQPGETITVRWQETIGHPGHFRISFDADGQDDFIDPASYTDFYTNDSVLLDDIPDQTGTQIYQLEITLPDIECENCTLQVVQVMTDKPPYTVGGNDLYYQCADLILRRSAPAEDAGVSAPDATQEIDAASLVPDVGVARDAGTSDAGDTTNDDGSGCSAGGSQTASLAWLLVFAALFAWRRPRRP